MRRRGPAGLDPPAPMCHLWPMLEALYIGPVRITPPLALAPMAGVTDAVFRRMVRQASAGGLGLRYTEFVSVEGITRHVPRLLATMRPAPDEHPIAIQIYGRDPERMAEAAQLAEAAGADLVDINAGCPVRNVVRKGGGAALMREPELLARLVARVKHAVRCPVTVKIRAGWDPSQRNAVDVARRVAEAGADGLTIHGRTRDQLYTGLADWEIIRQVREALTIPVLGNGDISTPAQANRRLRESGVAGLMIGRAAMGNPWIFRQIFEDWSGRPVSVIQLSQRLAWWLEYGRQLEGQLPPLAILGRMKQLALPITHGLFRGAELRRALYECRTLEQATALLTERVEREEQAPPWPGACLPPEAAPATLASCPSSAPPADWSGL